MGISDWSSDVCSSDLWVSRVHRALILARTRGDIDYVYTENVAHGSYEQVLRQYAEKGVHLIVGEAFRAEEIGRESRRESACQAGSVSVVAVSFNKTQKDRKTAAANRKETRNYR